MSVFKIRDFLQNIDAQLLGIRLFWFLLAGSLDRRPAVQKLGILNFMGKVADFSAGKRGVKDQPSEYIARYSHPQWSYSP